MSEQNEGKDIGHEGVQAAAGEAADPTANNAADESTDAAEDRAAVDAVADNVTEAIAEVAEEAKAVEEEIVETAAATIAEVDAEATEIVDAIEAEAEAVAESAAEAEAEIVEAAAETIAEVETEAAELVEAGEVDAEEAADMVDATEEEILDEAGAAIEAVEAAAAETVSELAEEAEAVAAVAEEIETEVAAEALTAVDAVEEASTSAAAEGVEGASAKAEAVETETDTETDTDAESSTGPDAADGTDTGGAAVVPEEPETKVVTDEDGTERVVRVLAVGMAVEGVVKRTTDFGAFVDIGVGRDGLIHISELSVRRVAKVTDVLTTGQQVTAWIKQLDRERNRISLTLISPDTKTIRDLNKGDLVKGTVTRIVPYGAFVDIGVGRDALLHIREMAEGYIKRPEDVVQVGEELEARIIELSKRRGRIDLSIKGLRPEPDAAEPLQNAAPEVEEEELQDSFADVEVLSPMELAFQRAMADETEDVDGLRKKRGKRGQREDIRAIQDEIINRTLEGRE